MTHFLTGRWHRRFAPATAVFILYPLLVLSACRSPTVATTTAESSTPNAEPTPTSEVFGPGPFNLPAPVAGLSDLSSYRATLTRSFEGTQDGQPLVWSRSYVMLMLADQSLPARHLMIEAEGGDAAVLFAAEVHGALYQREGEDACNATVSEEENFISDRWEPAGYLFSVMGAEPAGSETINGVATDHYTFDERAIGGVDVADATGEVWVASEGGYVIKYVLTVEAGADFFGEGRQGTTSLDYALTDINQPITVALPADCPAGMVDAPLLPDAVEAVHVPGLISYTTSTSTADAAAFYQEQLPTLGWQPLGEPIITETSMQLDFKQGDQQLSVIIITDEGVTTVLITLGPITLPEEVATATP
jgi:hypothetical protein